MPLVARERLLCNDNCWALLAHLDHAVVCPELQQHTVIAALCNKRAAACSSKQASNPRDNGLHEALRGEGKEL
jgi:hypothetical protein